MATKVATKAELIGLEVTGKPFREAVAFLQGKAAVPTAAWHEMLGQYHAKAFTVAGAVQDTLLADFYTAVDAAISKGETLAQFRKRFDDTVARHGWSYNGSRGWRSQLIYNANVQTAYQAGRYKQLQEIKGIAPYWKYSARNDGRARPQHRAWNGLILRADDPWWDTHYPPNGWNCRCRVWPRTNGDLKRAGKTAPDAAPPLDMEERVIKATGETVSVPKGIDTGWDYNVGKAGFGETISKDAWSTWQKSGGKYEVLTHGDWQAYGRPETIPADQPVARKGKYFKTQKGVKNQLTRIMGGNESFYEVVDPDRADYRHGVVVNATTLAKHIDPKRSEYLPFLPELMSDPYEIWMAFERNPATGRVQLRKRYIKVIDLGKEKGLVMAADSSAGHLVSWTFIEARSLKYVQNQRRGRLLFGRK